jgi:hypothetical protein
MALGFINICRACGDDILATDSNSMARSIRGDYGKHGIRSLGLGCSACDTGELNAGSLKDVDLRAAIKYSAGRMRHELLIKHAAV